MEIKVDLANFITIGLIAFVSVWVIDHALGYAGLSAYKAGA